MAGSYDITGVDLQSSGVAWAHWPEQRFGWLPLPKFSKDDPPEKRYARLAMLTGLAQLAPEVFRDRRVYVERPYGPNRNAQSTLMQVNGAFIGGLRHHGIWVDEVNTGTWKNRAFGPKMGQAGKDYIFDFVEILLGPEWWGEERIPKASRQDVADSICIAYGNYHHLIGSKPWET